MNYLVEHVVAFFNFYIYLKMKECDLLSLSLFLFVIIRRSRTDELLHTHISH